MKLCVSGSLAREYKQSLQVSRKHFYDIEYNQSNINNGNRDRPSSSPYITLWKHNFYTVSNSKELARFARSRILVRSIDCHRFCPLKFFAYHITTLLECRCVVNIYLHCSGEKNLEILDLQTQICEHAFEFEVLTFHAILHFDTSQHIDVLKFKFHDMSFGFFVVVISRKFQQNYMYSSLGTALELDLNTSWCWEKKSKLLSSTSLLSFLC